MTEAAEPTSQNADGLFEPFDVAQVRWCSIAMVCALAWIIAI